MHYLEHGCDTCTTGDHAKVFGGALLRGISFEDGMHGELSIFVIGHVPWKTPMGEP